MAQPENMIFDKMFPDEGIVEGKDAIQLTPSEESSIVITGELNKPTTEGDVCIDMK